jgi:hypothetical protein
MSEELEICAADFDYDESQWNGWQREGKALGYTVNEYGAEYAIDLERFTSSAEVLDFIMQVAGKTWATDACLAGLVRALNDILNPQVFLCSWGTDKRLKLRELRHLLSVSKA